MYLQRFLPYLAVGFFFSSVLFSDLVLSLESKSNKKNAHQLSKSDKKNLATKSSWLKLLHIRPGNLTSDILSSEFFLTPSSETFSAEVELDYTINAFLSSDEEDVDAQAHCLFPARFLWLSQFIHFEKKMDSCERLKKWAKLDDLRSVSLVMVSGYFGNPASSFGHTLLKINNHKHESRLGLLDLGVNYGALVPENEMTAVYILKGLFGGYQAGFSDKEYYSQDQIYSRTEFRDMWEYALNFNDFQNKLLVFHVWEIAGKKFQYFFLKQNCSYRLAELIELVTGEDLTSKNQLWFAPVELIHKIKDVDEGSVKKILHDPIFIPSDERILEREIAFLTESELDVFYAFIRRPSIPFIQNLSPKLREDYIVNTLLSYYKFKLVGTDDDRLLSELKQIKKQLLSLRLQMPVSHLDKPSVVNLRGPSSGSKPSRLSFSSNYNKYSNSYLGIEYSGFHYDTIGDNVLNGSSLVVFDLKMGFSQNQKAFLDNLVFVGASKNPSKSIYIPGESALSWDIGIGLRRESLNCLDCVAAYVKYAVGKSAALSSLGLVSIKMGVDYDLSQSRLALEPTFSLIINQQSDWGAQVDLKHLNAIDGDFKRSSIDVNFRYTVQPQLAFRFGFEQYFDGKDAYEASLSIEKRL